MSPKGQIKLLNDNEFATYLKNKERAPEPISSPLSPTPESMSQDSKVRIADSLLKKDNEIQITRHLKRLQLMSVEGKLYPESEFKTLTAKGLKASVDRLYSNPLSSRKQPKCKLKKTNPEDSATKPMKKARLSAKQSQVPRLEIKTEASLSTTGISRPTESTRDDRYRASAPLLIHSGRNQVLEDSPRLDLSGNTLTQPSSPNWLANSLNKYLKLGNLLTTTGSPTISPTTAVASQLITPRSKRTLKRRKQPLHIEIRRLITTHGQIYEEHTLKRAKKKEQMLKDLNKLCLKEGQTTKWGDFVGVVYSPQKETETLPDSLEELEKLKSLNERMFKTMGQAPAELYRIISRGNFLQEKLKSPTAQLKNENWTEEHEDAFKGLVRKTHPKNPIVKTMRFRALEKALPDEKHLLNTEWKYDKRSPWVNDLDYQEKDYLSPEQQGRPKRKPISNIKTTIRDESPEVDEEELKVQELLMKTGQTQVKNLYSLQEHAQQIDRIKDYDDAVKCFDVVRQWKASKSKAGAAKLKVADHIIAEKSVDSKELSRARYAYLSSKVAAQRANCELTDKMLNKADEKRIELRRRQEEFQRLLTSTRALVRRIYGDCYMHRGRRSLKLTSYAKGHPFFIPTMIKMGYLPPSIEAKPERLKPGTVVISKREAAQISSNSLKNLSQQNFKSRIKAEVKPNKSAQQLRALIKIQKCARGFVVRNRLKKLRLSVIKLQHLVKRRFARRILYESIVSAVKLGKLAHVRCLVSKHRYFGLFMKVAKRKFGSIEAFNRLVFQQAQTLKQLSDQVEEKTLRKTQSVADFHRSPDRTSTNPMPASHKPVMKSKTTIFRPNSEADLRPHIELGALEQVEEEETPKMLKGEASLKLQKGAATPKSLKRETSPGPLKSEVMSIRLPASPKKLKSGGMFITPKPTTPSVEARPEAKQPVAYHDLTEAEQLSLVGSANQINALLDEIRRHRAEMWGYFLSSVSRTEVTDSDLAKLLAKNSLYLSKVGKAKAWEETYLRAPFNSNKVTPEELVRSQPDEVLHMLSGELRKALDAKEMAKAKYRSNKLAWEQFAKLELPGSLPTAGQLKNFEALLSYDGSPTSQILSRESKLDKLPMSELSALVSSLEEHLTI